MKQRKNVLLRTLRQGSGPVQQSNIIRKNKKNSITKQLNTVYSCKKGDGRLPESIMKMQFTAIKKEQW
jgi:hypothetical protein